MASFQRLVSRGKNGKTVSSSGRTRNTVPQLTFVRIATEQNGDIRKIADVLGQPVASTKGRYENLQKKGIKLPPMNYVVLRQHTEMTSRLQAKLISSWQNNKGDAKNVADELGVSVATVVNWIKKFDEVYLEKNIEILMEKFDISREEALDKMSDKNGNIMFHSPLYEKQSSGQRGRSAAELDLSVLEDISSGLEENLLSDIERKEKEREEKLAEVENLADAILNAE